MDHSQDLSGETLLNVATQVANGMSLSSAAQNNSPMMVVNLLSRKWAVQSGAVQEQTVDTFDGKHLSLGSVDLAHRTDAIDDPTIEEAAQSGQDAIAPERVASGEAGLGMPPESQISGVKIHTLMMLTHLQ